jgi:hypothetical protein
MWLWQTWRPMQHATNNLPPRNIVVAIQLIWLTIVVNVFMMAVDFDDTGIDAMVLNSLLLVINAFVVIKITARKNWSRMVYAFLVALDVALILAFGLDEVTDLDILVTYVLLALECWALVNLFGAEADRWFNLQVD